MNPGSTNFPPRSITFVPLPMSGVTSLSSPATMVLPVFERSLSAV